MSKSLYNLLFHEKIEKAKQFEKEIERPDSFQPNPEWCSNLCNWFASVRAHIIRIQPKQHTVSEATEIPLISSLDDDPFQQLQKLAKIDSEFCYNDLTWIFSSLVLV